MSAAVKRACDACHRRKVKCDGVNPCRNCSSAQLACTYNAIPQKKGPKGSRAKVISELRETQRQSSLSAKIQNRMNGSVSPPIATLAPTPGLLTNEMVKCCIDFFFAHMYPSMPILSRQRLEQDAMSMDTTLDTYCLLSSLSAFMMLQPGMSIPGADPYGPENMPGATIVTATLLLEETIRVRKGYDYLRSSSLYTLATSYFLFACYYGFDLHDKAWFSLREATTLVHLVHMDKEDSYLPWDNIDASRRRRLYWLLFVAERAYAIQYDRPLSLKASINSPTPTDDPSDPLSSQLVGFCRLVSLFRPFDFAFVDLWNKTRAQCSSTYVSALQKQHNDVLTALASADPQLGNAARNQQWLQALAWQINMSRGNTASSRNDMAAYQYPMMDVSREIVPMASTFSAQGSPDLLSSGLIETMLALTSDLTDVLSVLPSSGNPFTVGPREYLNQLSNILAMLRIGEHRFTPLLLAKIHEILPRLANPMLQNSPEPTCEMDIFDGFGSAGMAQPPCLSMNEYKSEGPSSAGGAPSLHDVNSPYVSSPPILSPGLDYSHGIPTDFTPMSDLVMHHPVVASNNTTLPSVAARPNNPQHPPLVQTQHQPQLQMRAQKTPIISGLAHSLGSNTHIQSRINHGMSPTPNNINAVGQAAEQPKGLTGVLGNQAFGNSMNGMGAGLSANGIPVHQQAQPNGFGLSPQQIRTVGDFHALQRVNSDISSLGLNSMGAEMDFSSLR